MIEIRYLIASLAIGCIGFTGNPAYSQDRSQVNLVKALSYCGDSLLPCRNLNQAMITTLPYWRGNAPAQPIRVTYSPAFPRTNR
jgi:hypothetical protein